MDENSRSCRTRQSSDTRFMPLLGGLAAGLIGCQQHALPTDGAVFLQPAAAPGIEATAQLAALDTEDFEIVDCLLSAQIRRLGKHLTVLGARRPIRTTGRDCGIRGGEYVAYDRANYATALKIWLPLAEQGDPQAQTYVGEIYEKGLGHSPDYALAASWYQRAAEQGYATAQVSLGQLYERGLGVPKDMLAALDLYREASGLGEEFEIVSAAKLQALQGQADQSQRNADMRAQQVEALEQGLHEVRAQLMKRRDEAEAERRTLEIAHQELARQREALRAQQSEAAHGARGEPSEQARQLDTQHAEREAVLARRSEELERRIAEMSVREAEHAQKVAAERASIQAAQRELQVAQGDLAEQRRNLEIDRQLELQRQRQADEQTSQTRRVEAQQAELQKLIATLEERGAELARRSEELDRRIAETAAREAEHRQHAMAEDASIEGAQRELAEQRASVDSEAHRLALQRERQADEQASHMRLVEARQAEFREQHAALEQREAELARRSEDLDRRIAEIESKKKEADDNQANVSQLTLESKRYLNDAFQEEQVINYGDYYALVIGNIEYQYPQEIPALKSPKPDAEAIASLLKEKYNYVVMLLLNANRDQILGALNTLRETLREEDNLLIYYAGHGVLDGDSSRGYWLPVDAEPYPQTAKWISADDVTDILDSMRAKHVLVVADSCYSGSLTTTGNASLGLGVPQEERFYWLKTIANKPSRMAMTSGNLSPVLDGGGGRHSIFAMALLEVLGTNDRVMEGWRVYLRVSARVSDVAEIYGLRQVPTYGPIRSEKYTGGDYLFVRG
jgi:Caspase domain/Sel1 repeat